ncbi:MAG: polysaccharide pyruvyl transferase family protein [Clostridia bacterium]
MKDNIILLALKNDHNLGDQVICECMSEYLKNNIPENTELRVIDMTGNELDCSISVGQKIYRVFLKFISKLLHVRGLRFIIGRKNRNSLIQKNTIAKIKNTAKNIYNKKTKCIIFAGGGLIKYKQQQCHFFIDGFTNVAEDMNIPVMISAAGVEGYDVKNNECQMLKKAINRNCVKVITTRDDIECLKKNYKVRKDLIVKKVADPACSYNKVVNQKRVINNPKKVIGLGVTRKSLFLDYGVDFSPEEQIVLWNEVITELQKRNYDWEMFTNGLGADQQFASEIIEYCNLPKSKLKERPLKNTDLVNLICSYDATIVCRLHASIVSYAYNVPTVGLVWNNKQKMFGESIGSPERFITRDMFNAKYIVDMMEKAIEENYSVLEKEEYANSTYVELQKFINSIKD